MPFTSACVFASTVLSRYIVGIHRIGNIGSGGSKKGGVEAGVEFSLLM
jgi:hypothetical protein